MMGHPDASARTGVPGVLERLHMTVRVWLTISAVALVALGTAFALRVFSPLEAPELVVTVEGRAESVRLPGVHEGSCWGQQDGELRCVDPDPDLPGDPPTVPASGRMRIVAAFPVQPDEGTVRILEQPGGDIAFETELDDRIDYDGLEPGDYVLRVEGRYPDGAFVRYAFPMRAGSD